MQLLFLHLGGIAVECRLKVAIACSTMESANWLHKTSCRPKDSMFDQAVVNPKSWVSDSSGAACLDLDNKAMADRAVYEYILQAILYPLWFN